MEKHDDFWPILEQFWATAKSGEISVVTSELTLLEVLVKPISLGRQLLIDAYDKLLLKSDVRLLPIDSAILREAARLRATQNFKTPDAIHAATASLSNCGYLISNDLTFRRLADVQVVILSDLI